MVDGYFGGYAASVEDDRSDQNSEDYNKAALKPLTVTFQNLTITTKEKGTNYGPTVLSEVNPVNWFHWSKNSAEDKVSLRDICLVLCRH